MHIKDLDLNLLRLFDEVYRCGSVSAAAERLDITQPAASQGLARLRATLATFTEARIESADAGSLTAIFTTRLGFRDEVVFVPDPVQAHIHFRSRSLLGYYDFGKNRSRMEEVTSAFLRQQP